MSSSPTENRVRRLLRNASKLLVADALAALIGFLQAIVLARSLGAGGYGLLSLVLVFATVFYQLLDLRLWETATKFIGEYHERQQHGHARAVIKLTYLVDATTGLIAFLLVVLIASPAAERIFHRPEATILILCYSVTLLVSTVNQTSVAILRVFDRFTTLGVERIIFAAVKFLALWWVAVSRGELLPIVWTYVAVDLCRAVVLITLALRAAAVALPTPGPDGLRLLRGRLREFVRFSIYNSVTMFLSLVTRQLDVLILAALRPDQEVGFYRMAKSFARLLLRVSDPVYQAIYPELIRLKEQAGDLEEIRRFITRTMGRVMLVVLPIAVMIALGAPILIERVVDTEFLPAAIAVRIMIAGVVLNAALLWARPLALTAGRPEISAIAFAWSAGVLLVGSAVLVPPYGYIGSAITFLLTMSTAAGLTGLGAVRAARAEQRVKSP